MSPSLGPSPASGSGGGAAGKGPGDGTRRRRFYLDSAATSHPKPPEVWEAYLRLARGAGAPAGRSAYREALETDRAVEEARIALGRFFGARPDRVAFTLNATDALNLALKGVLRPGDHAVTTQMEHNSVMRPLSALARDRGVLFTQVAASPDGWIDPDDLRRAIGPRTRLLAMVHASNVCGTLLPVREAGRLARERDLLFLLDAAQTAGTLPIDLAADGIDLLAVPGHKGLLGPPGTGALLFSERADVAPLREGGTGSRSEEIIQPLEYPQRLEAGSPNAPGIAALGAGVEWIERRGLAAIRTHLEGLMRRLQEGLEEVPGLVWHGPRQLERREPVYALRLEGYSPGEMAAVLDASFGVQGRAGLHCAPGAHRALGTFPDGALRLSIGATSAAEDIEAALAALRELAAGG